VVEGNVFERFHLANGTDAFHFGVVEHGHHGVHEECFDQHEQDDNTGEDLHGFHSYGPDDNRVGDYQEENRENDVRGEADLAFRIEEDVQRHGHSQPNEGGEKSVYPEHEFIGSGLRFRFDCRENVVYIMAHDHRRGNEQG